MFLSSVCFYHQLPSLSDQYNLKSSMASSSSYLSEPTLGNGSAPFSYTGSSGTTGLLTNRTELKESHDTGEVNGNTLNELKLEDTTEKVCICVFVCVCMCTGMHMCMCVLDAFH